MSSITLFDTRSTSPARVRRHPAPPVRRRSARPVTCAPPVTAVAYDDVVAAPAERDRPLATTAVRLTRRGRAVVVGTLVAVALTAVVVSGTASVATAGADSAVPVATTTVTVEQGQSLWEIARAVAPDTDPRTTISRIVERNDLPSAGVIRAGQRLTVPLG